MILAGKCPPEPDELQDARDRGFNNIELYLEKQHLDTLHKSIQHVRNSGLNVTSIHTPHVHLGNKGYLLLADKMAQELDAFLVFHSQYMHHTHIPQLEELDVDAPYGYENNPGASAFFLEHAIIDRGYDMVLDVAHLYIAETDFLSSLKHMLTAYAEQVQVVHMCDSTKIKDGLAFGAGDMDMAATAKIVANSDFDGVLVFEVMPEHQEAARDQFVEYTA